MELTRETLYGRITKGIDMKKIVSVISLSFLILFLLSFVNQENVYSEQNIEQSKITPRIPDSEIWENISPGYYYNKINITKSSNFMYVYIYKIITDNQRKNVIETLKKNDLEKSIKYKNWDHYISLKSFDCKNRKNKFEEIINYDDEGNILSQYTYKNNEWKSIPPETLTEELYNKVCVTPKRTIKEEVI